ncbi:MAG TPA: hypothetical protein VF534_01950 [Paraburkholderia sp.]
MNRIITAQRVWSPEDDAILIKGREDGLTSKQIARLLHDCTEAMVKNRRAKLNLPVRVIHGSGIVMRSTTATIRKALERGPCTRAELRKRAGVSRQSVERFINEHRAEIHICRWGKKLANGSRPEVFKLGAGEDKPKPSPMSKSEIYKRWYEKQKRDRPDAVAARSARDRFHRREREGKVLRRDPAAVALFGAPALKADSAEASLC